MDCIVRISISSIDWQGFIIKIVRSNFFIYPQPSLCFCRFVLYVTDSIYSRLKTAHRCIVRDFLSSIDRWNWISGIVRYTFIIHPPTLPVHLSWLASHITHSIRTWGSCSKVCCACYHVLYRLPSSNRQNLENDFCHTLPGWKGLFYT